MVDLSNLTIKVEAKTFTYGACDDKVAYVRTGNPKTGSWTDWRVIRE